MSKNDVISNLASYISSLDIDEFVCKKVNCKVPEDCRCNLDCIDCIISFFSTPCKWYRDNSVCVNDSSEYCADFVGYEHCGSCKEREV